MLLLCVRVCVCDLLQYKCNLHEELSIKVILKKKKTFERKPYFSLEQCWCFAHCNTVPILVIVSNCRSAEEILLSLF